ncbi:CHAT domain-containing protein [Bradyrhizobium japonicum]|uniref:CHAT domain-containing protein n=1 Tax=Bradyrhizobium japonicum TaxID=375 RepID=UPI00271473BE|nr:CHAT domain-containing tetratricopeptide repeat protein [Bradyrhizobium japonicum]WLB24199.1 CHAT domain-containing protein [Bradyrhizobium japonicum]
MRRIAGFAHIVTGTLVLTMCPLSALDLQQAIENCRTSNGKPAFMVCKQSGGTQEACFAKAKSIVQSCVKSAMSTARPKAALFSAEKLSAQPKPSAEDVAKDGAVPLVAPPRTVSDISAILDQQKPDPDEIARQTAAADAAVPPGLKGADLADFYYKRAQARALLGRRDALNDAELAVNNATSEDYNNRGSRYEQLFMRLLWAAGENKRVNALLAKQVTTFSKASKGKLFGVYFALANGYLRNGDINAAESYVARNRALLAEAQRWPVFQIYGMAWQALVEDSGARVEEARGRFAEAEAGYHKASILHANSVKTYAQWESKPPAGSAETSADWALALEGRVKVKQGRVGEGEADVRRALLSRLSKSGKYHVDTAGILGVLVYVVQEQGRYEEAEQLQRQVIAIYQGLGYSVESAQMVSAHLFLAQIINLRGRYDVASKLYDQVDVWTANWEPSRRQAVSGGLARVAVMLSEGSNDNALEIVQRELERERQRSGDKSFNTSLTRGFYAIALARKNKAQEALQAFKECLPVLVSVSGGSDDDGGATAAAREGRVRFVIEGYLRLLTRYPELASASALDETFGYADVLRGQSVQRALQASSARYAAKDSMLAQLVRTSQDLEKQIGAAFGTLNNLLAAPASERDEKGVKGTEAEIARLQATRSQTLKDIAKKFPDYGNLVHPPLPAPADLQAQLTPDEALLSFYFGRFDSFLWVLKKNGPVQLVRLNTRLGDANAIVNKLREALEPNAAMISDIPPFDLSLAYDLYALLLKQTEAHWKSAKNLIVVTNGALGLLPLSLLPAEPTRIDPDDDPLFSSYRKVPWLARSHSVTVVPSLSALLTLRKLPVAAASRQQLIGFGDPLFSKEQAVEAAKEDAQIKVADASNFTRGAPLKRRKGPKVDGVDSLQLSQLPRLPDTAEELKAIALTLQADPAKVLNLGKDANEKNVKSIDLSKFKIIAFATHGLVPGELDGLSQPALALTAPAVADSDGDGLLTMEEILALKLDADWVVLSACNTGAGVAAGAEAASGLGRAFFYAGTRALLITNWSVHSQSAKELITDLFRRQAVDPKLTRAEALQQAMMALADGPGYVGGDGKTEFSYAHPLFWAPYSIIGDGGAR